jgi:hypothetical protein
MIIILEYDYQHLTDFLQEKIAEAAGREWADVAQQLGRLGRWEFEDYMPAR